LPESVRTRVYLVVDWSELAGDGVRNLILAGHGVLDVIHDAVNLVDVAGRANGEVAQVRTHVLGQQRGDG